MNRLPVYILAGGRSSRFGTDKARAELAGTPVLTRLVQNLQPWATRITVVARRADEYADLGLRTIADAVPGQGPLGGLAAALADLGTDPWLLLVACDHLAIPPTCIQPLCAAASPHALAVAFRPDRWEPLLALYNGRIAPMAQSHLARHDGSLQHLLDCAGTVSLPLPADWHRLRRFNTPEEFAQTETVH